MGRQDQNSTEGNKNVGEQEGGKERNEETNIRTREIKKTHKA